MQGETWDSNHSGLWICIPHKAAGQHMLARNWSFPLVEGSMLLSSCMWAGRHDPAHPGSTCTALHLGVRSGSTECHLHAFILLYGYSAFIASSCCLSRWLHSSGRAIGSLRRHVEHTWYTLLSVPCLVLSESPMMSKARLTRCSIPTPEQTTVTTRDESRQQGGTTKGDGREGRGQALYEVSLRTFVFTHTHTHTHTHRLSVPASDNHSEHTKYTSSRLNCYYAVPSRQARQTLTLARSPPPHLFPPPSGFPFRLPLPSLSRIQSQGTFAGSRSSC
ncbi:uncharacterized protein BDZ83DRAFT_255466 [Colletotrichum acutatum]|uniref:Uncharacterized protein n=1 Tax=Glomerella acutata TaxID=27357 RepID=A0AAD8USN6_GLOAC|nr:uncharacterized protein BDZ83DRAFT_255466 [Colletotrichum acutatum]KAK1726581.1 hypothetical protein BDZ83DRAFT_255466 [Colletotrichum acutatum]